MHPKYIFWEAAAGFSIKIWTSETEKNISNIHTKKKKKITWKKNHTMK